MAGASVEQPVYDRLWQSALESFRAGRVVIDPHLLDRAHDTRRGITLVARPTPEHAARLMGWIERLRRVAPDQHYYRPDELHLTVLSLIGAAEGFDLDAVPVAAYHALFEDLFRQVRPFTVQVRGITASPDAVLACGFVEDGALNRLRDRLREALPQAGLAGTLDRRYRITTAHSTLMRFTSPPENLQEVVQCLKALRARDLGAFEVGQIDFVVNDWYMSHDRVALLARYPLRGSQGS